MEVGSGVDQGSAWPSNWSKFCGLVILGKIHFASLVFFILFFFPSSSAAVGLRMALFRRDLRMCTRRDCTTYDAGPQMVVA